MSPRPPPCRCPAVPVPVPLSPPPVPGARGLRSAGRAAVLPGTSGLCWGRLEGQGRGGRALHPAAGPRCSLLPTWSRHHRGAGGCRLRDRHSRGNCPAGTCAGGEVLAQAPAVADSVPLCCACCAFRLCSSFSPSVKALGVFPTGNCDLGPGTIWNLELPSSRGWVLVAPGASAAWPRSGR